MRRKDPSEGTCKLDAQCGGLLGELIFMADNGIEWRTQGDQSQAGWSIENCCKNGCKEEGEVFLARDLFGASLEPPTSVFLWSCPTVQSAPGSKLKFKLLKSQRFESSSRIAAEQFVEHVQREVCWGGRSTPPKIVAVVNPLSGQGKGSSIFGKQVLPLLRDVTGMSVEVHATKSKNHATQIVRDLQNIDKVDAILYVGGDGTIFEGLQGLLSRPDWKRAATVPFATCPTGSGNGLAASLGVFDPVAAAFTVAKRRQHPIDVASVIQPPGTRFFSLLSLAYGLMSNLDIGTEHLRWMGEPRFAYGGVREVLGGCAYPLRAAVWPVDVPAPQSSSDHHKSAPSLFSSASPLDASASQPAASSRSSTREEGGPAETSSLLEHKRNAKQAMSSSGTQGKQQQQNFGAVSPRDVDLEAGPFGPASCNDLQGPPLPILSTFGGLPSHVPSQVELPPGWELLPEEAMNKAQYFMAHNTQYLALNARLNPKGLVSDGVWELITAQTSGGLCDKLRGLYMLLQTDTGDHIHMDIVRTQKIRAMLLEPQAGASTWTVLDGEAVENATTYLEVHPSLCRALVPPGWKDEPKP